MLRKSVLHFHAPTWSISLLLHISVSSICMDQYWPSTLKNWLNRFCKNEYKDAFSWQFSQFSAGGNDFGARTLLIFVKFGQTDPCSKTLEGTHVHLLHTPTHYTPTIILAWRKILKLGTILGQIKVHGQVHNLTGHKTVYNLAPSSLLSIFKLTLEIVFPWFNDFFIFKKNSLKIYLLYINFVKYDYMMDAFSQEENCKTWSNDFLIISLLLKK